MGALLLAGCIAWQPDRHETRALNAVADLAFYQERAPAIEGPVTLDAALSYAEQYNLEVWLAALERRFQHELTTQSLLKMLPSLLAGTNSSRRSVLDAASSVSLESGNTSVEPSYSSEKESETWNVEATWSLLDFGISFLRARQQANRITIAIERERRVRQNLATEVTRAWWQAVTARSSAMAADEVAEQVAAALEKLRAEMAAKSISEIDGLRAETRLLEQQEELSRYKRSYRAARAELVTLMGLPPGAEIELAEIDLDQPPPALNEDIPALEQEALLKRPELFEKDLEEAISRDEAHLALVQMFPNLSAFWRYDNDNNDYLVFNHWNTAGIRVTWDLLTIPQHLQQHVAMKLQTELVARRRVAIAVAILTQLHLALIDYRDAAEQLEIATSIADKYRALLTAMESAAEGGKSHDGQSLDQRMKYVKARARQLSAYANVMTIAARLYNTVGRDLAAETPEETPADMPTTQPTGG